MAYTKIIVIHKRLDKALRYVQNKEKTSLSDAIDYALNRDKTERSVFETGINCDTETAYQDMMSTKSIIDRCTASVYHDFVLSGGKARQPVLSDWRNEVKRQPEQEAQELVLASELFVEGSLNMFAHETNADIANRIVSFLSV